MEYPEVWFLGMDSKKVEGVMGASQNSGRLHELREVATVISRGLNFKNFTGTGGLQNLCTRKAKSSNQALLTDYYVQRPQNY